MIVTHRAKLAAGFTLVEFVPTDIGLEIEAAVAVLTFASIDVVLANARALVPST